MKSPFIYSFSLISMPHSKVQSNPKANVGKGHLLRSHNEKNKRGGGVAEVFLFSLSCQAFIIISSTSCKHQMPQTSATSTVSGQPPSAPWDICIYFLSPGSHCSPSICWRWLDSCLLGLIAASQSCQRFVFMAFFLYLPLALLPWWSDGLTVILDELLLLTTQNLSLSFY